MSILFMDIVGSTALAERLDPEALRLIMDRYFAASAAVIAEHGGMVEKFIGDAVLAVFGATVTHEDDAVRTVRAAAGCMAALRELSAELASSHQVSLEARCGICSGDVMVILARGGDVRVVGDAVNTAARLQTAAQPGEILICADSTAMTRGQVGTEPIPPLQLKGKADPVPAWRVTEAVLSGDGTTQRAGPLVGRDEELQELTQIWRRVNRRQQLCLVTVLGGPGIGKSRLVQEFLAPLEDQPVTVMSGRCSSYGRGITYQPLAEALGSGLSGWDGLAHDLAQDPGQGQRAVHSLASIAGAPAGTAAPDGPARATDPDSSTGSVGIEEIAWAVRYLLESLGRAQPVILILEDLHWAEPTMLDLIDDVASWLSDVPVLLLCVARTELLEDRPAWGGGKPCAMTVELGPLTQEQSAALVTELAVHGEVQLHTDLETHRRIAAECDGNPLFAELMLDVLAGTAPGTQIPPTIHALMGARLDQLPGDERQLLEMAAAIGREFTPDLLRQLAESDGVSAPLTDTLLGRLARRRLVRRAGGTFRFAQALLRDTAYASTPKTRRERWHLFLSECLSGHPTGERLAFAYHVEASCLLRRDLRPGDPGLPELASAAADVLIAEGNRALSRKDLPAAAALLERGRELLPAGDTRHTQLALHISDSWLGLWNEQQALAALTAAEAALPGSRRNTATCAVQRGIVALRLGTVPPDVTTAGIPAILADLEDDPADDLSWCRMHQLQAYLQLAQERAAAAGQSFRLGLDRAHRIKDPYEEERLACAVCEVAQWAPDPVTEGLRFCAELLGRFTANRVLLVPILVAQAHLTGLGGDLRQARKSVATALSYAGDLHLDLADAAVMSASGFVESLAGEYVTAEAHLRRGAAVLRTAGQAWPAQTLEAAMARAIFDQGRPDAAAAIVDRLDTDGPELSLRAQICVTALRGRIRSSHQDHAPAVVLAAAAADLAASTDDPYLAGAAFFDLAAVMQAAGQASQAAAAAATALSSFEAKGAVLPAGRVRAWLSGTGPAYDGDRNV